MSSHHKYLFDYRYKDLETGKLNIDKLMTINSFQSYSDLVGSGTECSAEYYEKRQYDYEQRIIRQQEQEKYALEQKLRKIEYEVSREKERKEQEGRDSTIRELREHRELLETREAELVRNIRLREEETRQIYLGGADHGRYIITNRGKMRQ